MRAMTLTMELLIMLCSKHEESTWHYGDHFRTLRDGLPAATADGSRTIGLYGRLAGRIVWIQPARQLLLCEPTRRDQLRLFRRVGTHDFRWGREPGRFGHL